MRDEIHPPATTGAVTLVSVGVPKSTHVSALPLASITETSTP